MIGLIQVSPSMVLEVTTAATMNINVGGFQAQGVGAGYVTPDGKYKVLNVTPAVIPAGQQAVGAPTYTTDGQTITEIQATEAIPDADVAARMFRDAIGAGVTLTWTTSTRLNGHYAIDPTTINNLTSIRVHVQAEGTFPNGTALQPWQTTARVTVNMSLTQFETFCSTLFRYIAVCNAAQTSQAAGDNPVWPSSSINVTG